MNTCGKKLPMDISPTRHTPNRRQPKRTLTRTDINLIPQQPNNFALQLQTEGYGGIVSIKQVLAKYKILQYCYALQVIYFRDVFLLRIAKLQQGTHKNTKPGSNRQEGISINECYKDFQLHDKFLLSAANSRVRPNRKEDTS